jgi:hypothetical protein
VTLPTALIRSQPQLVLLDRRLSRGFGPSSNESMTAGVPHFAGTRTLLGAWTHDGHATPSYRGAMAEGVPSKAASLTVAIGLAVAGAVGLAPAASASLTEPSLVSSSDKTFTVDHMSFRIPKSWIVCTPRSKVTQAFPVSIGPPGDGGPGFCLHVGPTPASTSTVLHIFPIKSPPFGTPSGSGVSVKQIRRNGLLISLATQALPLPSPSSGPPASKVAAWTLDATISRPFVEVVGGSPGGAHEGSLNQAMTIVESVRRTG